MNVSTAQNKEATTHIRWFTPADINVTSKGRNDGIGYQLNTTVVVAGQHVQVNRFKEGIHIHPHGRNRTNYSKARITQRTDVSIRRAKRQVLRLTHSNWLMEPTRKYQNPVWATLTYPNTQYAKFSNRLSHIGDMQKFMRILRSYYKKNDIRMLAVMELTQLGNVHWHLLIFDMPMYKSPKEVAQLWIDLNDAEGRKCSHGAQEIERIPWGYKNARKTANDIAGYLSKYLAKAFQEHDMSHTKLYLPSKGLTQPISATTEDSVRSILHRLVGSHVIAYDSPEFEIPFAGTYWYQILEPV